MPALYGFVPAMPRPRLLLGSIANFVSQHVQFEHALSLLTKAYALFLSIQASLANGLHDTDPITTTPPR
ncbi:hypothetical protein, partial [Pseudomonas gingeri]|uniref:hypothetical protein n=1 Tax=Pseudomonas gingeri TaxID=117681 RepID=UPI001C42F947